MNIPRLAMAPEKVFLAIGLVAGLLVVFVTPPFMGADEPAHLFRAYLYSEGTVLAHRTNRNVGGRVPRSLVEAGDFFYTRHRAPSPAWKASLVRLLTDWPPLDPDTRRFADIRNLAQFPPVPYLPHAFVLNLARRVEPTPIVLLYLARLAGLATSLALVYLAIRTTPIAKHLFVLLALAPTALRQASLVTADSVTNASAFLFIAMILRVALDPAARLEGRRLGWLSVAAFAVALSKPPYVLLLLLFFLCPVARAGDWRRYLKAFLVVAGPGAAGLAIWLLASRHLYMPQYFATDADPARQLALILTDPIRYVRILATAFRLDWSHLLMRYLGIEVLEWALLAVAILGLVALADGDREATLGAGARALLLAVFAGGVILVITFAYMGWHSVGAERIGLVQGRYYIPLAPLLFLTLTNRPLARWVPRPALSLITVCLAVISVLAQLRFLVLRWYAI